MEACSSPRSPTVGATGGEVWRVDGGDFDGLTGRPHIGDELMFVAAGTFTRDVLSVNESSGEMTLVPQLGLLAVR